MRIAVLSFLGFAAGIFLSSPAHAQNDINAVYAQEQQTILSCVAMARSLETATRDQLDAAGLNDFEPDPKDIEQTAMNWLKGLGATEDQINAAAAPRQIQVQSMLGQLSMRNGSTTEVLIAPMQQCGQLHTQYSKDQCRAGTLKPVGMPRIPVSMLQTAKTCREEQAQLATSAPASHVIGNPEAEARFEANKNRAVDLMRGYDRLLKGQPIPQCGRFSDEFFIGKNSLWYRHDEDLETLIADGVIDYYNACGDFEKWIDEIAARENSTSE